MKSELHKLADEQVDYYKNNAEFSALLKEYYVKPTKEAKERMFTIAYQCACNYLKKRYGHWWDFEKINDWALEILAVLFRRIEDRKKWPEGYGIYNLPSRVQQIWLLVYYRKNEKQKREEISLDYLLDNYGDSVYNILADTEDCLYE